MTNRQTTHAPGCWSWGLDHSVGVCMCDYWNIRREMKAALSKENSND